MGYRDALIGGALLVVGARSRSDIVCVGFGRGSNCALSRPVEEMEVKLRRAPVIMVFPQVTN